MKARSEPEIEKAVAKERLLVLSPFDQNIKRVTKDTAEKRNRMMIGVCDCIIVGHIIKGGQLNKLLD